MTIVEEEGPTPREWQILNCCQVPKRFSDLNPSVDPNPTRLAASLKKLRNLHYLAEDIGTRKYITTEEGKQALEKNAILSKVPNQPSMPVLLYNLAEMPTIKTNVRFEFPENSGQCSGSGYSSLLRPSFMPEGITVKGALFLNEEHARKLDEIEKKLKESNASDSLLSFFYSLGGILCDIYGHNPAYRGIWEGQPDLKDLVLQEKIRRDFDATIVFHYNGRDAVKKVDWKKLIENSRKHDEEQLRWLKKVRKTVKKNKDGQMLFMTQDVASELEWVQAHNHNTEKWIGNSSQSELEEEFSKHLLEKLKRKKFPGHPTERDVEKILERLQDQGKLKIVTRYTFEADEGLSKECQEDIKRFLA
jgi:hypothetical protein